MIDLKLNYAREAKSSMDRYLEESQNSEGLTDAEDFRWMVQTIAMSLVSIADSLHRIVEEETA